MIIAKLIRRYIASCSYYILFDYVNVAIHIIIYRPPYMTNNYVNYLYTGAVTFCRYQVFISMLYIGAYPCTLFSEDGRKLKYFIRTVKLLQVTLIKQSNI